MPSSFLGGVENFNPALEGQRISIAAGSAMRQGLQGIEQVGQEEKMMKQLDAFASALNSDYVQRTKKGSSPYPNNAAPTPGSNEGFYGSW